MMETAEEIISQTRKLWDEADESMKKNILLDLELAYDDFQEMADSLEEFYEELENEMEGKKDD